MVETCCPTNMAENTEDSIDELHKTPLSPIVGTPCDELDPAELFEGYSNTQDVFSMGNEEDSTHYLSSFSNKVDSEGDSASSELEDIYASELGVTPPRNVRRNKERSRTQRKGQGLCLKIPVKVELEKKKRERERTSQKSMQNEIAFQREYKRSSLGSTLENEDLSRSLNLPNVKIDSKKRFMSLKCTRRDNDNERPKHRLTRSESDPKNLGQITTNLSQSRQEFIRTFSLLIKIGAHACKQKDSQFASTELERQNSEEHKKWQIKRCLALWLELCAWHGGRTMEEQDKYLMEERAHVEEVLDEFIQFNLNNVVSHGDDDDNLTSVKDDVKKVEGEDDMSKNIPTTTTTTTASATPTVVIKDYELEDTNNAYSNDDRNSATVDNNSTSELGDFPSNSISKKENLSLNLSIDGKNESLKSEERKPICSTPESTAPKGSFCRRLEFAITEITELFGRLESVEQLYPTKRAVGDANPKYLCREFNQNVDALLLWLNMTKELLHQLTLISRFLGIDSEMQEVWQDWIDMGMGMLGK